MIITAGDVFFYTTNNRVNTDDIINDSWIELSQLRHIKKILTSNLYDAYINDEEGIYEDLDTFIKPALSFFTLVDNFDFIHLVITDNGTYKITQRDGTESINENERYTIKAGLRNNAQKWAELLTEHLNDNYEDNDLYKKEESLYNTIKITGGLIY